MRCYRKMPLPSYLRITSMCISTYELWVHVCDRRAHWRFDILPTHQTLAWLHRRCACRGLPTVQLFAQKFVLQLGSVRGCMNHRIKITQTCSIKKQSYRKIFNLQKSFIRYSFLLVLEWSKKQNETENKNKSEQSVSGISNDNAVLSFFVSRAVFKMCIIGALCFVSRKAG